jgi:uncharacterized protein
MTQSPFHDGERQVQSQAGVREIMERKGSVVIRNAMLEQHRNFFALLPYFVVSTADQKGQPWASMLFGQPGFVSSLDPTRLSIKAWPGSNDPVVLGLRDGASIGGLGIELPTRRRNRVNGTIGACLPDRGFELGVTQSFGNCPKYIQARRPQLHLAAVAREVFQLSERLDEASVELIVRADTFFIASRAANLSGDASQGLDVSHRGGLPGFVRILSDREIAFPDYKGNLFYNTLGNIAADQRVGLLFVDFKRGTLLHVAGRARIDWNVAAALALEGVERQVFVIIDQVVWRDHACPLTFEFVDYSPYLRRPVATSKSESGSHPDTGANRGADRAAGTTTCPRLS